MPSLSLDGSVAVLANACIRPVSTIRLIPRKVPVLVENSPEIYDRTRITDGVLGLLDNASAFSGFHTLGIAYSTMTNVMTFTQSKSIYNVPNALTSVRLILAIAVILMIPLGWYLAAMVTFVIAASTDWIDGYWARKYGQVTKLGRIFDPFVDKIIICGSFIALAEAADSGVAGWMATVVVGRELLVTSLRGMVEGAGGDFSASQLGKWKMVLQCAAVVAILLSLMSQPSPQWLVWTSSVLLWSAIALTIYSGIDYVFLATRAMRSAEGDH